ncbi:DUF4392 domain-containing protein [Candidatus Bathyarchaeota archaeon]|nr:DUF4392 domain-containing protein [Candidatus Bathyarchaeota archaeon]
MPTICSDVFRRLDDLISIDVGSRGVDKLYVAATKVEGGLTCVKAAETLCTSVQTKRPVILTTGFTIISAGRGETDGPPGAAVLAEQLEKYGVRTVVLTDRHLVPLIGSVFEAVGLANVDIKVFPQTREDAKVEAENILRIIRPSILIAIERCGWNALHVYHNMLGEDISSVTAPLDILFEIASQARIATIGIGDGGNEIGMGKIRSTVRRYVRYGKVCRCPCRGGIANITKTTNLIVSGVSNWGAYALAASFSILSRLPYFHDGKRELALLKATADAGAVDGRSGINSSSVDGVSIEYNAKIAQIINSLVKSIVPSSIT